LAENATAAVPAALFDTTLTSALLFAAGQTAAAGTISAPAMAAAEGVLKTMHLVKLKIAVAVLLLVAVAGSGAGVLVYGMGDPTPTGEQDKTVQKSDIRKIDQQKPPTPADPKVQPEPAMAKGLSGAKEFIPRLANPVEFHGFDDPKFTFQDALEYLADRYSLSFDVDEAAFRSAGYRNTSVLSELVAKTPIPRMRGVSLAIVLRKILSRLKTPAGKEATYIISRDQITITTRDKTWSSGLGSRGPDRLLVDAVFDGHRLGKALHELAASSGVNLVIDPRVEEKAETAVSATLLNVPVDTAVRVLADMADLQPAFLDNVIYVTSKENAKRLEQGSKKREGREAPLP
jgi:hypothetical protein